VVIGSIVPFAPWGDASCTITDNYKPTKALASHHRGARRTLINAKDVTDVLCHVMHRNVHRVGISALEVSTRSLQAGEAMTLIHGRMDMNKIQMIGQWNIYTMMRYLHIHSQPIMGNFASHVFNKGTYNFLPD
jgi:hypothetical protein